MSTEDLRKQLRYDEDKKDKKNRVPYLPPDYSSVLSPQGLEWLQKYDVSQDELNKYRIGWSDESRSLVFPAYDCYNNLLIVQLRTFDPSVAGFAKYYTRGFPESVYWSTAAVSGSRICLVEDFVSAVRVGRTLEAAPLWGSQVSLNQIRRLSDRYEELYLWLDYDKTANSLKFKYKAAPFFKKISIIVTEKDPKEYSDAEIAKHLGLVS